MSRIVAATLLALLSLPAIAEEPKGFKATSDAGHFVVTLRPAEDVIPIGRFHRWSLRITDADGRPVEARHIEIGGGMEAHGHGLPTAPRAVATASRGEYTVEGLKLTMAGEWTLLIGIQSDGATDAARFKLDVDY